VLRAAAASERKSGSIYGEMQTQRLTLDDDDGERAKIILNYCAMNVLLCVPSSALSAKTINMHSGLLCNANVVQ
jgi:hypothetical protein